MLNTTQGIRARYARNLRYVSDDAAVGTFIPVRSKLGSRASFAMGLVKELPAVFTVFAAAASALHDDGDATGLTLAAAEVIAGACVLVVIVLEARHLFGRHGKHAHAPKKTPLVDASGLAAAALGFVEAWHHARVVGHFKLLSPTVVGATLALLAGRIKNRPPSARRVRTRLHVGITPEAITYVGGPRKKWRATWSEVAAVEHYHGELAVRLHDGQRHVLRADDHLEDDLIGRARAAIAAHAPHVPHVPGAGAAFAGPDFGTRAPAQHAH